VGGEEGGRRVQHLDAMPAELQELEQARLDAVERGADVQPSERDITRAQPFEALAG
jgi:hypothetical protein